jgi:hypothetical protein
MEVDKSNSAPSFEKTDDVPVSKKAIVYIGVATEERAREPPDIYALSDQAGLLWLVQEEFSTHTRVLEFYEAEYGTYDEWKPLECWVQFVEHLDSSSLWKYVEDNRAYKPGGKLFKPWTRLIAATADLPIVTPFDHNLVGCAWCEYIGPPAEHGSHCHCGSKGNQVKEEVVIIDPEHS